VIKDGIKIIQVKVPQEAIEVCKNLFYEKVLRNSVLFLSGGSTPKILYEVLAQEKKLSTGAVAMVDDRFGKKMHQESNELMIKNTQLLSFLQKTNTKFYPILENKNIKDTTTDYDETVRYLFNYFQKSVGLLGIGKDGHIAGLPIGMTNDQYQMSNKTSLVMSFNNFPGDFKERITLTFLGLSKLDLIIVLVFGKDKKKALRLMFKQGSVSEVPARFLTQKEIAGKVIMITDQTIK